MEQVERLTKLNQRVDFSADGNTLHIKRSMNVEPVFEHVKYRSDVIKDSGSPNKNGRYIGSLDPITAQKLKQQSGLKIGTKEFAEYAADKIENDSDMRKFKADT